MLRIPVSKAEEYRGRSAAPRLQLQSEDKLPEEVLELMQKSTVHPATAELASRGLMPVHEEVRKLIRRGDVRREQVLRKVVDAPPTADWRLQTPSAFCFEDPESSFCPRPLPLPRRHISFTPDKVEQHTLLPTTHAALCATEELGRVGVLNASLLLHLIDVTKSDPPTSYEDMQEFLTTARSAAQRVASNLVDVHQLGMYHRRWSLTQGAEQKVRRRLLQEKTDDSVTAILTVKRPHEASHTRFDTADEEEVQASTKGAIESGAATSQATPVKLTISDVESVLGVVKSRINTPQSTSSLSSFVNRVSSHVVSDFLSEFQFLGGGEGDLSNLNNLQIK